MPLFRFDDQPAVLKYTDELEAERAIDKYIGECTATNEAVCITGLALALDCVTTEQLYDLAVNSKFKNIIQRAILKCEHYTEKQLFTRSASGAQFILKTNFGWKDESSLTIKNESDIKNLTELSDEQLMALAKKSKLTKDSIENG